MKFKEIPASKIMDFFKTYFPEKEGYSVNSVGYDEEEDRFVIKCFGRDRETNCVYMFTLFALNPDCSAVVDDEFYPIAYECSQYGDDFWTGDEVQEEYPKFINSLLESKILGKVKFTNEEFEIYEKVRLAIMRDEIEQRLEGLDDDYEVADGVTLVEINNDEFLNNAAEQLVAYLDNFDGEEVWHIIRDCIDTM